METENSSFTKQCTTAKDHDKDIAIKSSPNRTKVEPVPNIPFQVNFNHLNGSKCTTDNYRHNCSMLENEISNEEPIDLTTFSNKEANSHAHHSKTQEQANDLAPSSQEVSGQTNVCYPKRRRKRRKFAYTADGKLVLVSERFLLSEYKSLGQQVPNDETLQSPASFSESKQLEILKAAKSLFSKRTRTLYHWMYPNAAKPQIKAAVTSSWESLGAQEKDFYISQVLGRFGFPQSSLMVNPQLGGIKELPLIAETSETKSKSRELQSAISSIMPENPMPPELGANSLTFEEFEEINELTKKRRGRPPGSSNKKHKYNMPGGALTQDFKDDPELSQELEQFATMFNLSKI